MGYMISKFKGKYQLRAPIDEDTKNFPTVTDRADSPKIEDDVFINCRYGKITHYGRSILTVYIEPYEQYWKDDEFTTYKNDAIGEMVSRNKLISMTGKFNNMVKKYKDIIEDGSIMRTDCGGSFNFNIKHIDGIAKDMGAFTSFKSRSPFSKHWLRDFDSDNQYKIPKEDDDRLKLTTGKFDKTNMYKINMEYKKILDENGIDYKNTLLKTRELIHKHGLMDLAIDRLESIR